ncbi:hypothetical protein DRQ36_01995 [bacterium]|nr:MAG: hypothetical protein DRQ36_01995 [bacterium]
MKSFKIALTRTYLVTIKAENEDRAKQFVEYYLGNCPDLSTEKEQKEKNFSIEDIEMVHNEAQQV